MVPIKQPQFKFNVIGTGMIQIDQLLERAGIDPGDPLIQR